MTSKQVKVLLFSLLTIASGIFFWYQTLNLFKPGQILIPNLIYFGAGLIVFLVFLLLLYILAEARGTIYLAAFLLSLIFALMYFWQFGFQPLNYFYLLGVFLFFVFLLIAYEIMGLEKEDRIKISAGKVWKRGLTLIMIALSLIISVVYYFQPILKISQDKIELPPQLIKWMLKPMSGMFNKMLPFYSPEMTIDEMLASSLAMGGGEEGFDVESLGPEILSKIPMDKLTTMSPTELLQDPVIKTLIAEQMAQKSKSVDSHLIAQQRDEFAKSLGVELKGSETMDEVLGAILNSKLGDILGPYYKQISLALAVTFFFLVKFIFSLVGIVVVIAAQLLFFILKASKFVTIEIVNKEGEALSL